MHCVAFSGIGSFYFHMSDQSMQNLRHALSSLLCSATSATEHLQLGLLIPAHLSKAGSPDGKSIHELSETSRILCASWCGCYELVVGLARHCGRHCLGPSWRSMHNLKFTALHEFASTLTMAAAEAEGMQYPFQG